jgi:hypothetical protein
MRDHLEIGLSGQQLAEAHPKQGVVVQQ